MQAETPPLVAVTPLGGHALNEGGTKNPAFFGSSIFHFAFTASRDWNVNLLLCLCFYGEYYSLRQNMSSYRPGQSFSFGADRDGANG